MNRAGLTGQQAMILHNYLKAREDEITEQATDACIREAQEKLERAEDYITITNIIISIYAIKFSWGFTKANKKFLDNWKSAMAGITWKKHNIMRRTVLLPGCHYQNHMRRAKWDIAN